MSICRTIVGFLLLFQAGCGTFVPSLRDWPADAPSDSQKLIRAIVRSVRCQLEDAVTKVVRLDQKQAAGREGRQAYSEFLDQWGAEVLLTFTIVDKTSISPSTLLMPPSIPSSVLTIAGGLDGSAQATRIEKINVFYTVRELFRPYGPACGPVGPDQGGSLLIENDLHIEDLLAARLLVVATRDARAPEPGQQNVLSHQITFQVITAGNITPSWKLVRATVNPAGPLFDTRRDRTHELLITFGPTDRARGGRSLSAIAEQTHLSSQISSGLRSALTR